MAKQVRRIDLIRQLKPNEHNNIPKCVSTSHEFRKDKKFRSNEEMFHLSDDEIINNREINKDLSLPSKCCRLAFLMDKSQLANIYRVHGEGIRIYDGGNTEDSELNIPKDPDFGFDMTKPEEGYPCVNLNKKGGCKLHGGHEDITKQSHPYVCKLFPRFEHSIRNITTCSYTFDKNGNRSGVCNGCING